MTELISTITSPDPSIRNRSLDCFCASAGVDQLLAECAALDDFRRRSDNLYERVRALFFLYAIHRFHLPFKPGVAPTGSIPFDGYTGLLERRFEESIRVFLDTQHRAGPNAPISSALASAYRAFAFQTLADQVRRSVRSVVGNRWMFRIGSAAGYPLRLRPEMLAGVDGLFAVLREATPVRMDLSHSGWSDIFFLGMDFPEGARVLNVSIDLAVRGRHQQPSPPVEACFRVIDQPVIRLVSVDLKCTAEVTSIAEVFDFGRDYLGLLKAALIAAGIVPPGLEGSDESLAAVLAALTGKAGHGIELVTRVNDIPKGSRLAVSTNLLACVIAVCMRATGQAKSLSGPLSEPERRLVAARAILGEWLGGSGGGWQDSGGLWPAVKLIEGVEAVEGDAEFGVSRGCLLPRHTVLPLSDVSLETRERLQRSLVLVHGGMAQDVGPILEMVTEKYLLRSEREWTARQRAISLLDDILARLRDGNVAAIGRATQENFDGPIQTIIPWAGNLYTEMLIEQARAEFGADFRGFWMLGGMSGGGMGFIFNPERREEAQGRLQDIMHENKRRLESGVPFAIEPTVYDFRINERGSWAEFDGDAGRLMPAAYYNLAVPELLRRDPRLLTAGRQAELQRFASACRMAPELSGAVAALFDHLLPQAGGTAGSGGAELDRLLAEYGFDRVQHEQIQDDLRNARIGLAQNRLPVSTTVEDVRAGDITDASGPLPERYRAVGTDALKGGEVAVVSLAGGAGSRWTHGAGVVKALNPFARLSGRHRTFIEVHVAKSRRTSAAYGCAVPHVITTSYMTHAPIEQHLRARGNYGYAGPLILSPGRAVGVRMIPMARDLHFAWEEMPQQVLDEQAQKMRSSVRAALLAWVRQSGEGSNYTANAPMQCLHPVGHWYEIPNLMRNGVLASLLAARPALRYLLVHNIDTLGADLDPALLGLHIEQGAALTFEVVARHIDDRGGGLARVNGRVRLVEGLAFPSEDIESRTSYYNSATTWVHIDHLLGAFGLSRADVSDEQKVTRAIRQLASRMPTYITLKDVKKRWGKGQEDVYPVAQYEKLWGDMTALPGLACRFAAVSRFRGQQLKDVAQLDGWLRDGSAAYVDALCDWA